MITKQEIQKIVFTAAIASVTGYIVTELILKRYVTKKLQDVLPVPPAAKSAPMAGMPGQENASAHFKRYFN